MLPKPDKSKKKFPSDEGEQIETKEERLAKDQKRLQKKRRFIIISIILTVGLSLSFWTYRSIKNFLSQPHSSNPNLKINFSKLELPKPKGNDFDNEIQKFLDDFKNISLYITDDNLDNPFIWQQNESALFKDESIENIKSKLDSLTPTDKSSLKINLPVGLTFQEIVSEKSGFDYFNQINLPGKKLVILIHLDNKQDISVLVESIYWAYIQQFN